MIRISFIAIASCLFIGLFFSQCSQEQISGRPNVIIIMTDDQGYGDLACHGNPYLITPNIDSLYEESVRFTDFHVGTTCAPTRAGLLTGINCNKVGVWHTVKGRSLLKQEQTTMADIFKENGYKTSIFGKWHLGDNYPFRPQDRGFDEVLIHGGGGIGQVPDYWDNDYFDDTYFRNGKPEKFAGYCTDVWFNQALDFIERNKEQPFFCYLVPNAPHSPYHVPEQYIKMYDSIPELVSPNFFGMITNLDENVGILKKRLKQLGLLDNTILIFMTDNGTSGVKIDAKGFVSQGYNAGMRGRKGSEYEGGHRVPFFLRLPKSKTKEIVQLTSYLDVLPTLIDLCGLSTEVQFEGHSLQPLIEGKEVEWTARVLVTDTQREENLIKEKNYAVMSKSWRLINGKELYDISKDPGQQHDVSAEYPDLVSKLREDYEVWWEDVSKGGNEMERIVLGDAKELLTNLNCMDWHNAEKGVPLWNQNQIREGIKKEGFLLNNGFWALNFRETGKYLISLRRWPQESGYKFLDEVPAGNDISGGVAYPEGEQVRFLQAGIKLGDIEMDQPVDDSKESIDFEVVADKGSHDLRTWMTDENGSQRGAYYVIITKAEN